MDGDGVAAERPYLSVQFTASDVDTVVEQLVDLVRQAIDARAFAWAELKVVDDPHGMVVDISPKRFDIGEDSTADVAATVTLRGTVPPTRTDRVIPIDLVVAAEGEVAVSDVRWWVVVPGTGVD